MAYCSQCGEILKAHNFCMRCGKNSVPHLPNQPLQKEELGEITSAVRGFMDVASDEKKEGRTHQQKWKLFETHYQRTKGITLEQSLLEIENFMDHGVTPQQAIAKFMEEQPTVPTVGGIEFAKMLEDALQKKQKEDKRKSKRRSSSKRSSSKRSSVKRSSASASAMPAGGAVPGSTIKGTGAGMPAENFDPKATSSGDAFFSQFKSKQNKTYGSRYHG